jgi:hypothetical protein
MWKFWCVWRFSMLNQIKNNTLHTKSLNHNKAIQKKEEIKNG